MKKEKCLSIGTGLSIEKGEYCLAIKESEYVWDYTVHFFHLKKEEF